MPEIGGSFANPRASKGITPFTVMMVLLIALVPLFGGYESLVDISAAMLCGTFGLKEISSSGDEMGRTILNIGLIGLYTVFALAAFLFSSCVPFGNGRTGTTT